MWLVRIPLTFLRQTIIIPNIKVRAKMPSKQQEVPPLPPPPEVYNYIVKELGPLKREIFPLWQELAKLRITIWESIKRNKLNKCQETYDNLAARWINAREKVTVLDKLISPNDKEAKTKLGILMLGGYLEGMAKHENELSRIMNDISNMLRDKKSEADFKRALLISTLAVCIAVVSIIISVF